MITYFFKFGKYKGKSIGEVYSEDPDYIIWIAGKGLSSEGKYFWEAKKHAQSLLKTIRHREKEDEKQNAICSIYDNRVKSKYT